MNKDDLKKYMETLDPELKEFLGKEGWRKKLRKTCSDYAVKDEQLLTNVENEIFLIMIGVEYVGNLISLLENAGIPKIQAEPLSEAIAKNVLFDVAEFLSAEEAPLDLPDGAVGSLPKSETVIKNPITLPQTQPRSVAINQQQKQAQVNIQPTTNNQQQKMNGELGIVNKEQKETPPQTTQLNQIPKIIPSPATNNSQPATNLSWEERKKRAEEALKNVVPPEVKKYPGAADPYREPVL